MPEFPGYFPFDPHAHMSRRELHQHTLTVMHGVQHNLIQSLRFFYDQMTVIQFMNDSLIFFEGVEEAYLRHDRIDMIEVEHLYCRFTELVSQYHFRMI